MSARADGIVATLGRPVKALARGLTYWQPCARVGHSNLGRASVPGNQGVIKITSWDTTLYHSIRISRRSAAADRRRCRHLRRAFFFRFSLLCLFGGWGVGMFAVNAMGDSYGVLLAEDSRRMAQMYAVGVAC